LGTSELGPGIDLFDSETTHKVSLIICFYPLIWQISFLMLVGL